jgi:hypothetical protein
VALPIKVIDGRKLMQRWGMSHLELVYMIMNHELKAVYRDLGKKGWQDLYELYSDMGSYLDSEFKDEELVAAQTFWLQDVLDLEERFPQLRSQRQFIKGKELVERWGRTDVEIFDLVMDSVMPAVDPVGEPMGSLDLEFLLSTGFATEAELLFRLDDVENLEQKYPELKCHNQAREEAEDEAIQIPRETEDDGIPAFSFYKNGQFWRIGEVDKEKDFKDTIGLGRLHFLLLYPRKELRCKIVAALGKQEGPSNARNLGLQDVPKESGGAKRYNRDDKVIDKTTEMAIKAKIAKLEEELASFYIDPEESAQKKEELQALRSELKKVKVRGKTISFRSKDLESCRTSVQKSIRRALEVLHKEIPVIKEFLNKDTIRTGSDCCYKPDLASPIEWILHTPNR